MTIEEAIEIVCNRSFDWAGEYGFSMPDEALEVFDAIKTIEQHYG